MRTDNTIAFVLNLADNKISNKPEAKYVLFQIYPLKCISKYQYTEQHIFIYIA